MNDNNPVMGSLQRMQAMYDRIADSYLGIDETMKQMRELEEKKSEILNKLTQYLGVWNEI